MSDVPVPAMIPVEPFSGTPELWDAVRTRVTAPAVSDRATITKVLERLEQFLEHPGSRMALEHSRTANPPPKCVLVGAPDAEACSSVWVIGDTHGDLLALEASLAAIDALDPTGTIVFLGDLIDDGPYSFEVLLCVFELVTSKPQRVCVLGGNHDLSLYEKLNAAGLPEFASGVEPGDFAEWLQGHADDPIFARCGRAAIRFFAATPRALVFPQGLLISHGGFPHADVLASLVDAAGLEQKLCLDDFAWARIANVPKKLPNRYNRGHQFGWKNFEEFSTALEKAVGVRLTRMVRGHDHIDASARFDNPGGGWGHRVVTVNNLCFRQAREMVGGLPFERQPCLLRWEVKRGEDGFTVVPLQIPAELVAEIYAAPTAREVGVSTV